MLSPVSVTWVDNPVRTEDPIPRSFPQVLLREKERVHVSTDNYFSYPKPAFPVLQRSRKVCKMGCVDTTKEGTSDGNSQAVVFYNSFALYFKLKALSVKADLKI